jgi:uncharacterized protein
MSSAVLAQLRTLSPEVELAILLDEEGAVLASDPPQAEDESLPGLAAPMLTALAGVADRTSRELGRGLLGGLVVRGPSGQVVVEELGDGRLLGVIARPAARLGVLLDDVREAASRAAREG